MVYAGVVVALPNLTVSFPSTGGTSIGGLDVKARRVGRGWLSVRETGRGLTPLHRLSPRNRVPLDTRFLHIPTRSTTLAYAVPCVRIFANVLVVIEDLPG